jgi:signal transduction histidine kinase
MLKSLRLVFLLIFLSEAKAGKPSKIDSVALNKMDVYSMLNAADEVLFSDLNAALSINDKALAKGILAKDWVAVFYAQRERGIYFEIYNLPKSALEQYKLSLPYLDSLKEKKGEYLGVIWNDIAIANRKCGNYQECATFHEKTLHLGLKAKDLEMQENSYHGLGLLYETIGEWEKSLEYYQKSVNIAEASANKKGIVISFQNIANVLLKSENEKLALLKIEEAWMLSQPLDTNRQAHVLNDYGEILSQTGHFNEALTKFQQSLVWYERLNDQPMIGRALLNMANTYSKKGDQGLAIEFFHKSLELKNAIRPEDLVKLWYDLGLLYQKEGAFQKANEVFLKSHDLAQHLNFRADLQKSQVALAQLLAQTGEKVSAYDYLQKATVLGDSLASFEKERRIAEMDFRYKTTNAENKIAILEAKNTKITFGSAAFGALLFSVFMFFMYWQKRKNIEMLHEKNQKIEQTNKQLRESNEVLQQFAYATAHDLKEPLRTIGSFVGLLQKRFGKSFEPEAVEYFEFVKSGAFRMNALLTDLLEYSTVFMDLPSTDQTPILPAFDDVLNNIQESIRAKDAKITFAQNIDLQPLMIKKSHFIQLFQNILSNAVKFSSDIPEIEILISEVNQQEYVFEIKDNGIGIEPSYKDKIFMIFQRLNRQDFEGQGIGLALCKKIVEKYNGDIWVESKLGVGTSFFVRLPYKKENNVLAVAA